MYNVTLNIMQSILLLHETEGFLFLQIHKPSVETAERIDLNKLYLPSIARKNQWAQRSIKIFFPKFEYSTNNLLDCCLIQHQHNHLQNVMKLLHKLRTL